MKKLKLSKFDLGIIAAFVLIGLAGGGAWYYLTGQLAEEQAKCAQAKSDFDKNSSKNDILVSGTNSKTLQTNSDLLKAEIDPLVKASLLPKDNRLRSISNEDPVAWKGDLDTKVKALIAAAKSHNVGVPPGYYFSFSRYLSANPTDATTAVLSKQLAGVEELSTILIDSHVNDIQAIRRTYEEEPHGGKDKESANGGGGGGGDADRLPGFAMVAAGNLYTAYPYEVDFEATAENFRTVMARLVKSPYVFVVRTIYLQNSAPNSPALNDLDKLAAPVASASGSVVDTSPGETAAAPPTRGPQYLFGNSYLKIKLRVDMIEWTGTLDAPVTNALPGAKPPAGKKPGHP